MANAIAYASIFQSALDKQLTELLTSGWMEANAGQVRYTGGDTVKIPKMSMDGLGDYSRTTGFATGDATLEWETKTFTMDRGQGFSLDAMDVDESNFVATAAALLAEFQRTKVAPEVDAYRYSTLYSLLTTASKTAAYTPAVGTIFTTLKTQISNVLDVVGSAVDLVCPISYTALRTLELSTEFDRSVPLVTTTVNGVESRVRMLDGVPLLPVPTARFQSAYTFSATDGFAPTSGYESINWIIMPRTAPIAVVKTDKVRVFTPEQNLDADAWKIQVRKYHDIWVPDNQLAGMYLSYTDNA